MTDEMASDLIESAIMLIALLCTLFAIRAYLKWIHYVVDLHIHLDEWGWLYCQKSFYQSAKTQMS